jgi:hypothetical protein
MGYPTNTTVFSIGGPESTPGTAVARTHRLFVENFGSLDSKPKMESDPAISGDNIINGKLLVANDVSGDIPLSLRPDGGSGKLLRSNLGGYVAPVQICAIIRIRYTGSSASCKLVGVASAKTLTSSVGALGAESPDAAFGTAGVLTLTAAAVDTVAELVAVIQAYANYDCELVTGDGAASITGSGCGTIVDITTQGKGKWAYILLTSLTSAVYDHQFYSDLTTAERAVYSIQKDGVGGDNYLYDGCVADKISLSAALKSFVKSTVSILGFKETVGQTASALALGNTNPLKFYDGNLSIGSTDYNYIREMALDLLNNHNPETFGAGGSSGSAGRTYQQKGIFAASGSLQVMVDAALPAIHLLRATIPISTPGALSFVFRANAYSASYTYLVIIELPYINYTAYDPVDRNGSFDTKLAFEAIKPRGTQYDYPVKVHLVCLEASQL